jgi:hypothetical protein
MSSGLPLARRRMLAIIAAPRRPGLFKSRPFHGDQEKHSLVP